MSYDPVNDQHFIIQELSNLPDNSKLFTVVLRHGAEWVCSWDEMADEWRLKWWDMQPDTMLVDIIQPFPSLWHCLSAIEMNVREYG